MSFLPAYSFSVQPSFIIFNLFCDMAMLVLILPLEVIQNPLKGNLHITEGGAGIHWEVIPNSLRGVQDFDKRESRIHRGEMQNPGPGIWNLFLVCNKWDEMINHYR